MSENDNTKVRLDVPVDAVARAEEILAKMQSMLIEVSAQTERAKASADEVTKTQQAIASALAEAQAKMTDVAGVGTQAVAAATKINDAQAVIATKSDHIQKAQEHADKVRGELDRELTAAKQHANEAEGQKKRTESSADQSTELLAGIKATKGTIETDASEITAAKETALESTTQIKNLAEKSATVESRIAEYENKLADLEKQCAAGLEEITRLLPGATTAGLAHDWDKRRQSFVKPGNLWRWVFIGSLAGLVVFAGEGIIRSWFTGILEYDEIWRMWLSRIPVVGALVWLALYASREAALAKRLEEDYGYKSAIASTFLGFNKQMTEIGKNGETNTPLAHLCKNTLDIIATPPGRIYDKHQLTVSPLSELAEAAKALRDMTKNKATPTG